MLSSRGHLQSFLSYLTLTLAYALLSVTAARPTPTAPPAPPWPIASPARAAAACHPAPHQPWVRSRLGGAMANAVIYALGGDFLVDADSNVQLEPWKRARPLVLPANQGDCLKNPPPTSIKPNAPGSTPPPVSIHVQGMQ